MSGVWGWFGGQSAQKRKDTPKNAILGLRSQLEMLQKRERHLQNQIDEQDSIARKNVSTNKNGTSAWFGEASHNFSDNGKSSLNFMWCD
jgi:charged multivesicular body protein 4